MHCQRSNPMPWHHIHTERGSIIIGAAREMQEYRTIAARLRHQELPAGLGARRTVGSTAETPDVLEEPGEQ